VFTRPTAFAPRRTRSGLGAPIAVWVAMMLALSANDACAGALGSLVTSVGVFAALAGLFVIKGWPAQLPASALSTAGGALVVAGGAAWLWRTRAAGRWTGPAAARSVPDATRVRATERRLPTVDVVLPHGVDREALLCELRLHFVRLQEAWDVGAMAALQTLTTAEMLDELRLGRPVCASDAVAARTDIVTLRADLFAFDELASAFIVSVEFSGLMREAPGRCPGPFRELWMLTRSKDGGSGWKLARHQALL